MTLKVIRLMQHLSNAIRRTFVRYLARFNWHGASRGPRSLGDSWDSCCYSFHYTILFGITMCESWNFQSTSVHGYWPTIRVRSRNAISEPQSARVHNVSSCTRACILSSAWRLLLHITPLLSLLWTPTFDWNAVRPCICKILIFH